MNILGISCFFHDAAAALVQDGIVTAAAEEERFSRVKHDAGFPLRAIEFCLRTGKVRAEDLDWVVFYEKPFLKLDRLLMSTLQTFPRSFRLFRESMVRWVGEKLWVKGLIARRTGIPAEKILFSSHHMSHAASAFYASPYRDAAILTCGEDRKSTRLNSSHLVISYAVFCLKKKKKKQRVAEQQ